MQEKKNSTSSRALVIAISSVAVLIIAAIVLTLTLYVPVGDMQSREYIEAKLEKYKYTDLSYDHVWEYLAEYGIGGFDHRKYGAIEDIFTSYYVGELLPTYEHALETARLFLEYYYDDVATLGEAEITDALLDCYCASSGDKYAVYRNRDETLEFTGSMEGTMIGVGIEIEYTYIDPVLGTVDYITLTRVIDGGGADNAGALAGDILIAVDGTSIHGLTPDDILDMIRGDEGTTVTLTLKRGGETLNLTCTRAVFVTDTVYYELVDGEIAYITVTSFDDNTDEYFAAAIDKLKTDKAKGLVIDMRNNLGGYFGTALNMVSELVPEGTKIVSTVERGGYETAYVSTGKWLIDIPVVVLVNEWSASASELFTAAMRDFDDAGLIDARIVGTKTYGKGVAQRIYSYILDGSTITFTNSYFNPPSGNNFNHEGIDPDLVVEDPDEQRESAISVVRGMYTTQQVAA